MERPDPSEFVAFMRDSAKRALDTVAGRTKELDKPLRSIVKGWSKLREDDKDALIDELITTWMHAEEPAPRKRSVKEVEKTLPKKPKKAKASSKKK